MFMLQSLQAQREHFIYLQTADQQPFYMVFAGSNFSSSAAGHLVMPKLANGSYEINIGFPGQRETTPFVLQVNGKDQGFDITNRDGEILLKSILDATLVARRKAIPAADSVPAVVINSQEATLPTAPAAQAPVSASLGSQTATSAVPTENVPTTPTSSPESKTQPLTMDHKTMTMEEKIKALEEEEKRLLASVEAGKRGETIKPQAATTPPAPAAVAPIPVAAAVTGNAVVKPAENKPAGLENRRFLDMSIGEDSAQLIKPTMLDTAAGVKSTAQAADSVRLTATPPPNSAAPVAVTVPASKTDSLKVDSTAAGAKTAGTAPKKACDVLAEESDEQQLMEKLKSLTDEDEKIFEAKKLFRKKCVTTYQVRAIAATLQSEEAKYQLLDAAHPYTADQFNYKQLRNLLTEPYFLTRFDAMIR